MITTIATADETGIRIGPYHFSPKITRINAATLVFAAMASLMMLTFVNFVQGYVLSEILNIPKNEQGRLTGNLAAFQEVVVIIVMSVVGSITDKTGRRILFTIGFVILGAGYAIYPLADSVTQMYIFRVVVATGSAIIPVTLSACSQDYVVERSRGKWLGLTSVGNGLGVILMSTVLARLPKIFTEIGYDSAEAGIYAFWTTGAMCLFFAVVMQLGLAGPETMKIRPREPVLKLMREGFSAARNPRIALTYFAGFALRGDLVVVGTFFSLWVIQEGTTRGMPIGEVMARSGLLFGAAIQGAAFCWAPVMGWICDRVNRTAACIISFSLAAVGYLAMGWVDDPLHGWIIIPICIILGMGETSNVVAGGALLGQEAPARIRGSVVGLFNWCGAIGIMVFVALGGYLFDHAYRNAPFTMMGVVNVIVAIAAFLVWRASPGPKIEDVRAGRVEA